MIEGAEPQGGWLCLLQVRLRLFAAAGGSVLSGSRLAQSGGFPRLVAPQCED